MTTSKHTRIPWTVWILVGVAVVYAALAITALVATAVVAWNDHRLETEFLWSALSWGLKAAGFFIVGALIYDNGRLRKRLSAMGVNP